MKIDIHFNDIDNKGKDKRIWISKLFMSSSMDKIYLLMEDKMNHGMIFYNFIFLNVKIILGNIGVG